MFREVIIPSKKKPMKCQFCGLFRCSHCRYLLREWKRNESQRVSLRPNRLVQFSFLGMLLNFVFAVLMIVKEDHNAAFKGLCGSLMWAICIFIFDRKYDDN